MRTELEVIATRVLLRMGADVLHDDPVAQPQALAPLRPFDSGKSRLVMDHEGFLAHRHEAVMALLVPSEVQALLAFGDDDVTLDRMIALQEAMRASDSIVVFDAVQADELERLGAANVHLLSAPALQPPATPLALDVAAPAIVVIGHGAADAEVQAVTEALRAAIPSVRIIENPRLRQVSGIHVHVGIGNPSVARMLDSAAAQCPIICLSVRGDASRDVAAEADEAVEHEKTGLLVGSVESAVAAVALLRDDPILVERLCSAALSAVRSHNARFESSLAELLAAEMTFRQTVLV